MADTFLPVQAQFFTLAGAGCTIGATSIVLSSFQTIDGVNLTMTNFGTLGFVTVEPGNGAREEQLSFTGVTQNANGTATLTGVSTVLFISPYTMTSGTAKSHPGGAKVILSNTAGFYNTFANKGNNETITEVWTFETADRPVLSTDADATIDTELITKGELDRAVFGTTSANRIAVSGNAGETVAAGQLLYLNTADGEWYLTDADTANTVNGVVLGIAQGAGTNGNPIVGGILTYGLDANQTGLTANSIYYASNTAGGISSSTGTTEVEVGVARSTTSIFFNPRFLSVPTALQKDDLNTISNAAAGTTFYKNASALTGISIGTASQVWRVNSGATAPEWGTVSLPNFGDGSDGDVIIGAGTTTLTRDMYYDDLTIQTGGVIDSNGFRIFVRGTLTFQGTGRIENNGGSASGVTAGTAASTGGSLPNSPAGQTGAAGQAASSAGNAGTAGTAAAKCLGSSGIAGATGGTGAGGANAGGTGGAAGATSGTVFNSPRSIWGAYALFDTQPSVAAFTVQGGAGSGGSGGGSGSGTSGDGGGSGASGGPVWVAAAQIVTVAGNDYIRSRGGNGANGGNASGNGGGGGGGAGGNGGVVVLIYQIRTGSGTISVTAGTSGTGGNGAGTGANGGNAASATAGTTYEIQI